MRKLMVMAVLGWGLVVGAAPAGTAHAALGGAPKRVDTWAFCGVRPSDPSAQAAADSMARDAGVTATFGPCNDPVPGTYTPIDPGPRYVSPADYMQVVLINARAGMKTLVYDARIYGTDAMLREQAIAFWTPVLTHIQAWDLGDEYQPTNTNEWNTLKQRWNTVRTLVTPRTGVPPYANQLSTAVEQALTDLPGSSDLLSFTRYTGDLGAAVARAVDDRVRVLMCGINAYRHLIFEPTAEAIRTGMADLIAAGCDRFLVFGGQRVYDSSNFGGDSLVTVTGAPTPWASGVLEGSGRSSYTPVGPARLLETRAGLPTVDGIGAGVGVRLGGTVSTLPVAGRADVRRDAGAVVLNVTVTNAAAPGFVTVYPCDEGRPLAAQLNFPARTDVATAVTAKVARDGTVCFYSPVDIDLVVDVNGFFPAGASFTSTQPTRLLETRADPGLATVDGAFLGGGAREAGSTLALRVAGRGGVPDDATEAVLDVTVTGPLADGFVTVHPCTGARPLASNLNYRRGATVTNAIVAPIGPDGTVCLFTLAPADLVVDVVGYVPSRSPLVSLLPARLVDTRSEPGITTVDGQQAQLGLRGAQTATAVVVHGRAGVPTGARAAVLNLTATGAAQQGFVTAYPCTGLRPNASNLNVAAGATVANLVVAPIGSDGRVCLFTSAAMHLVVDVASWLP